MPYFKMQVARICATDKPWWECYAPVKTMGPRLQRMYREKYCVESLYQAKEKAACIINYFNATLREHEKPRTVLDVKLTDKDGNELA